MQAKNNDDLHGGQRSSEVKYGNICAMATISGQKNCWCKLRMMMTFTEVKGHQRSNVVNYATNLVGRTADASLGWLWPSRRSKANRGQIQWITYVLPIWYLVSRWGLGPKVCMHHFGCGMKWIKGYYMIVKVKNETFWFSTYSMETHSLTSSSFICLWGEAFGSRTILLEFWGISNKLSRSITVDILVYDIDVTSILNVGTRSYGPYLTKKWQLPYHIKILLLFERKVFEVNVSRVCNILHV